MYKKKKSRDQLARRAKKNAASRRKTHWHVIKKGLTEAGRANFTFRNRHMSKAAGWLSQVGSGREILGMHRTFIDSRKKGGEGGFL